MTKYPDDEKRALHQLFQKLDAGFRAGDFDALASILGPSERWFDQALPDPFGGGHPMAYAIYWSPLSFIEQLIEAGAPVNFAADDGFPALIAALSAQRADRLSVVDLLIGRGVDVDARGVNDWTPLHYATSARDTEAIRRLLAAGANPRLRTRIDNYSTALEDARAAGFADGAILIEAALAAG